MGLIEITEWEPRLDSHSLVALMCLSYT